MTLAEVQKLFSNADVGRLITNLRTFFEFTKHLTLISKGFRCLEVLYKALKSKDTTPSRVNSSLLVVGMRYVKELILTPKGGVDSTLSIWIGVPVGSRDTYSSQTLSP